MTQLHPDRVDLVLTGSLLTDGHPRPGSLLIKDGLVSAVTTQVPDVEGPHLDVGDDLILPGAVDAHVHSYSHAGEGFRASTSAAAAGGVTTIVEMPFDGTGPIGTRDRLRAKQDLLADHAVVDVALLGTMLPEGGWREAESLATEGVVGFKASLFDTDPFRFPRTSDAELLDVMRTVGETGSTLCVHAENNEIIKARLADQQNRESTDPRVHGRTRPPVAETLGILTAMEIAANEGNALHLCHLSLGRSTDLLRWYQQQGADVSFESCPHYLHFNADDMVRQGGRLKINPPLRTARDQEAMWAGVTTGLTSAIASDHAPWPLEKKDRERILDNASGVPGVQILVPTVVGAALDRYGYGSELAAVIAALTSGPAERYGLGHSKGALRPGMDADIVVLHRDQEWEIDLDEQFSNAGWTPYAGQRPGIRVTRTISRGETIWTESDGLLAVPGRGKQVRRR